MTSIGGWGDGQRGNMMSRINVQRNKVVLVLQKVTQTQGNAHPCEGIMKLKVRLGPTGEILSETTRTNVTAMTSRVRSFPEIEN